MTNLTHSSFLCIYFNSLHVSSNLVLIIRRINCINTSGICHSVSVTVSCASRIVPFRLVHETVTDTEWHITDAVLIQLILLMMGTRLLETCRKLKEIHRKELCVKLVIYQESSSGNPYNTAKPHQESTNCLMIPRPTTIHCTLFHNMDISLEN